MILSQTSIERPLKNPRSIRKQFSISERSLQLVSDSRGTSTARQNSWTMYLLTQDPNNIFAKHNKAANLLVRGCTQEALDAFLDVLQGPGQGGSMGVDQVLQVKRSAGATVVRHVGTKIHEKLRG